MSEIKYTPGPWKVGKWQDGQEVYIDAPNGEPDFKTSKWEGLAVVFGSDDEDFDKGHHKCEANANLISAAPDLLEALIQCREALRDNLSKYDYKNEQIMYDALKIANPIIAKATGKSS